jgi:crossover junction endodeoxyribonuclease RuvC
LIIMGIDPGFAACGWALVRLRPTAEEVLGLGVIETEKSDKKRQVRASDDNLRRARELTSELQVVLEQRGGERVAVLAAEAQSWPRNAGAVAKVGIAWGVVAALATIHSVSVVQASPQEVKKAICGRKDASKEAIAEAMLSWAAPRGAADAIRAMRAEVAGAKHEHAWDALAAVVTCLDSELVRMGRALQGNPLGGGAAAGLVANGPLMHGPRPAAR